MLKFITRQDLLEIELIHRVEEDDLERLKNLFSLDHYRINLYFLNIYSIPSACVDLLHERIGDNKKKVSIIVNRARLSKYLYTLGFKVNLDFGNSYNYTPTDKIDVFAIGGSSDSTQKILKIISEIDTQEMTIFIIQHVGKGEISDVSLPNIVQKYTNSVVLYPTDGMHIQKGYIYIAPPSKHMTLKNGIISLEDGKEINGAKPSISHSFLSLSDYYKERLVVLLSCGNERDGVDVLPLLKQNRSVILLEDPKECRATSIPKEAKEQGIYDYILSLHDIILFFDILQKDFSNNCETLSYLLEKIHEKYEYDFRLYNQDSVMRRVLNFMAKVRVKEMQDLLYLVLLKESAFRGLFLNISINVTELFRDILSFKELMHLIEKEHKNCYNLKIWSAGCSSGEEVYSTAILLNEMGLLEKSIIYATDFNPVVIEEAKSGLYPLATYTKALQNYEALGFQTPLSNYFAKNSKYVKVDPLIKKRVQFFVHNLEKDAVFNEFDIIECKNVLIYFNSELTDKIFQLLYDSLKFGGHILLGESEEISKKFKYKFQKYSDNCKIYRKIA